MRSLLSIDKVTIGVANFLIGHRAGATLRNCFVMLFTYCAVVLIPAEAQQQAEPPDPPNTCSQKQATECKKLTICGGCSENCYSCQEIVDQCGPLNCGEVEQILVAAGQNCSPIQPTLTTCTFQGTVGVIEDSKCLTSGIECNAPREAILDLVFPGDATDLQVYAVTGFVDDRDPSISFNGNFLINEQSEPNASPRALDFYQSLTQQNPPWVVPGSNIVRVSSWNQEGNWSIYVYLRGEYKTAGECNHVLPVLSAAPQSCQSITTCGDIVVPDGKESWDQNGDCTADQTDIASLQVIAPEEATELKSYLVFHKCLDPA